VKRVALVVLLVLVAASCRWLAPREGDGPLLGVHVSPPAAGGLRTVDITAPDLPDGVAAKTTVTLDSPKGPIVATGSTLPLRFTADPDELGPGGHVFYVRTRVDGVKRRGLGGYTGAMHLNQLQALGSHNSYHTYPTGGLEAIEALQYFQDPLDVQLEDQGVRQFELDVNVDLDDQGFTVVHIQGIDEGTTCRDLRDCLATIRNWSVAHPQHAPVAILLELKNAEFEIEGLPYQDWTAPDLDALDALIRSEFSEAQMFTPDDLRRGHATLPAAIATDGWPTIDEVRGQVMFMMDNGSPFRSWYREGRPGLAGRVLFTNANPGDDDAAFVKRNDAKGSLADIQSLVAQGYVVRTRTDADTWEARANDTSTRDAALASGAQWVSTDYVVPGRAYGTPYFVEIPGGTPARCNPINTPAWCTADLIESLP
jgi:hypothetical protein